MFFYIENAFVARFTAPTDESAVAYNVGTFVVAVMGVGVVVNNFAKMRLAVSIFGGLCPYAADSPVTVLLLNSSFCRQYNVINAAFVNVNKFVYSGSDWPAGMRLPCSP